MIERDLQRARRAWRAVAREPLRALIVAAGAHALKRWEGEEFTDGMLRAALGGIQEAFEDVADAGALTYFGIRDRFELGHVPVDIVAVDENGLVRVEVGAGVEQIIAGGDRRLGWTTPKNLTLDDLER